MRRDIDEVLIDLVPSYASLLVIFDIYRVDHRRIRQRIRQSVAAPASADTQDGRLVRLPVFYSADYGPDLTRLASDADMTPEQFVQLHSGREYRVYAIGFAPGFAYLGDVDERIAAPRLSTPRRRVPRGAVGIADRQTAIYPAVSPGGWNLIGLCPQPMFDPRAEPAMPVQVGDRVRFEPIDQSTYLALGGDLVEVG